MDENVKEVRHPQSGQHYLRQCIGFVWNPVSGTSVCASIDL